MLESGFLFNFRTFSFSGMVCDSSNMFLSGLFNLGGHSLFEWFIGIAFIVSFSFILSLFSTFELIIRKKYLGRIWFNCLFCHGFWTSFFFCWLIVLGFGLFYMDARFLFLFICPFFASVITRVLISLINARG